MACKEEKFYDAIGKWLVKEKGCQQDEYSQGYLKNIQMGDIRPDVLGIRYEIVKNGVYPVIHFYGHVVEVKCDEKGLNEAIGKIIRIKKRIRRIMSGLNKVKLYIAYPSEQVSSEIFDICKEEGIGILLLQVVRDDLVNIYEVLQPTREIVLSGIPHSSQRSPGTFEDSINEINYLRQMFQRPWKLYDDFITPKTRQYIEQIKMNEWLNTLTNKYARNAFEILKERLKTFPQLVLERKKGFVYRGSIILQLYMGTGDFKIIIGDTMYRVHSKDNIIVFKGREGKKYEGDLQKLITDIIIPYIKERIEN